MKTRRAPPRHCRDARGGLWSYDYGHAYHEYTPPAPPALPGKHPARPLPYPGGLREGRKDGVDERPLIQSSESLVARIKQSCPWGRAAPLSADITRTLQLSVLNLLLSLPLPVPWCSSLSLAVLKLSISLPPPLYLSLSFPLSLPVSSSLFVDTDTSLCT